MRALPRSTAFDFRTAEDVREFDKVTHFNWEGLLTALGLSITGWAIIAVLVTRLLR